MARIRTIKPEFWTDDVLVQLPFQARLLFIGIWNFADDHGAMEENADRLRMQIFPAEPALDAEELVDLLVAAGLLERFVDDEGKRVIQVRNWHKHQKVDNPAKSRVLGEKYRKLAIPSEARRAVAVKYGCAPGGTKDVACYFCGIPGRIRWWALANGRPSSWVSFDLELDHLDPEANGGANSAENLVLSCRSCNRGRRDKLALPWILSRAIASPIEDSDTPRGSLLGREKEGKGSKSKKVPTEPVEPRRSTAGGAEPDPVGKVFEHWKQAHRHPQAQLDDKRRRLIRDALRTYSEADLCQCITGYLNSPHHMGQNERATVYDSIELMVRDAEHIDAGLKFYAEPPRTELSAKTRQNVAAIADWQPPEVRNATG